MLDEVTTTVRPLVEKNANRLVLDGAGDLGAMRADLTKMRQVLLNLLSNACKFTDARHGHPGRQPRAAVTARATGWCSG